MTSNHTCPHKKNATCDDCRLSSLCLPLGFSRAELKEVDNIILQRPLLQKNDFLYRANDVFEHIYVVRSGCIKTVFLTEQGENNITGFYFPGDVLGMDGIAENSYQNSAIAIDTASVCKIPFNQIETLATQLPHLQRHMFAIMSKEISSDQQAMLILNKNKADARIAAFLLSLSVRFERQRLSSSQWTLPMSRGDLANFLGLTIESASRVFTRLSNQGILTCNKREIIINDFERLETTASVPSF